MKTLFWFLLATAASAQTINPNSQITWPRVSGTGAPTGVITCPASSNTPTTATVGTPYTDIAGPHYWQCGTAGWFQVDGAGGSTTSFKLNGTLLGGDFATNPQIYDYDSTTPVADAGYINATGRFVTASGKWNVEVPAFQIQPLIQLPDDTHQYYIIYPTVCTHNDTGFGRILSTVSCPGSSPGSATFQQQFLNTSFPPTTSTVTFSGWSLPASIPAGNVTGVYAAAYSSTDGFGNNFSSRTCSGVDVLPTTTTWLGTQVTSLTGLTGATIGSAACSLVAVNSSSQPGPSTTNVDAVVLIVQYTGTVVPQPSYLNVAWPLSLNTSTNTLGIDLSFPGWTNAITVAQFNQLSSVTRNTTLGYYAMVDISDGSTPTDCSVGGGANRVKCYFNGTAWVAWNPGGGGSGITALTGDVTATGPGSATATLATVNSSPGTCGDATHVCQVTTNGKGLTTAQTQVAITGGGGVSGQAVNVIGKATNATTTGAQSALSDDGTTVTSTEPVSIAVAGGQGGTADLTEGTNPPGAASHDIISADATSHQPIKNANNTGNKVMVGTSTTAATAGHCAQYAANGYDIADSGSACGGGGGGGGYTNVTGSISETTVAQINTACGSGTYYATTALSIATGGTITCPVQFSKAGLWTIASGQTVTFSSAIKETDSPSQHFTGSGVVVLAAQDSFIEWWGAIGYTTESAAIAGTDSLASIQACITAMTAGQCMAQGLWYRTTDVVSITKSGVGIGGLLSSVNGTLTPLSPQTAFVLTSATADMLDVKGASSVALIGNNKFTHFSWYRSVAPTGTAAGLYAQFTVGTTVDHTQFNDSIFNYRLDYTPSGGGGVFSNNKAQNCVGGFSYFAGTFYGWYLGTNGVSTKILNSQYSNACGTGPTTYGLYWPSGGVDYVITNFEVAGATTGIGNAAASLTDIHIDNPILDGVGTCINLTGASSQTEVTINGGDGWCFATTDTAISLDHMFNANLTNMQIHSGSVSISNSNATVVQGLNIQTTGSGAAYGIQLSAVNGAVVNGNIVLGHGSQTDLNLINSSGNSISNNGLFTSGTGVGTGVALDATSAHNHFANINVWGNLATQISDAGSDNQLTSGTGISGATATQALIAGSATTATSSKALAGTGAGLTTGPTTSVLHNCPWFADTAGTIADSGSACGAGGSGALTQISQVVASANQATITFSSIPGTYTDLELDCTAQSHTSGVNDFIKMTINSDTGAHYVWTGLKWGSVTPANNNGTSQSFAYIGGIPGVGAGTNTVTPNRVVLPLYANAIRSKSWYSSAISIDSGTMVVSQLPTPEEIRGWYLPTSNAAITQIDLKLNSTDFFLNGSVCTLYGKQ